MTNDTELPSDTSIQKVQIPDSYKDEALAIVRSLVKGNKFNPEDVKLLSFEGEVLNFKAETVLNVYTTTTKKTVPGRVKGPIQVQNEIAANDGIKKAYLALAEDVAAHRQIREAFLVRDDKGFAADNQVAKLSFWKKEFVVIEPCQTCHSKGTVTCLPCHGKGVERCPKCQGSGVQQCAHCNGMQMVAGPNGTKMQCPNCQGQGRSTCMLCNQSGTVQCRTCRTKGVTTCPNCQGNAWNSHIFMAELSAKARFDYPRSRLPDKVVATIDRYGVKIRDHATIEISQDKESVVNADDEEKQKRIEGEDQRKDLRLPIIYDVTLPYGHVEYDIGGKSYYTFLFGKNAELSHVSPFIDDLVRDGVRKLKDASELRGDVGENLQAAAGYRTLREGIYYAMRFGRGKAAKALKKRNALGLSDQAIKDIVTYADQAIKNITKKPRMIGLAAAGALYATAFGGYFFTPFRSAIASRIPNEMIELGVDLGFAALLGVIGMYIIQGFAQKAITSVMRSIMPKDAKSVITAKLGNVMYLNYVLCFVIFAVVMEIARQQGADVSGFYASLIP